MSNVEEKMLEAMKRLGVATVHVSCVAEALVESEIEGDGVSPQIFEDLYEACAEMQQAREEFKSAKEALVVDAFGASLEGAGEGGMTS